ncbi:hypothetical protein [Belnapia rosea]|uniref:hypothetical protein n=1 Tax=Belnapia rosea TaxID=938405 RepID=UPI0011600AEB|nr:hypothetical protein [Belnapia rosea]
MDDKTKPTDAMPQQVETDAAPKVGESLAKSGNSRRPPASDPASSETKSNDMKPGPHQLQGGMRS